MNGTASVPHLGAPTDVLHLEGVDGEANAGSISNHCLQKMLESASEAFKMSSHNSQVLFLNTFSEMFIMANTTA